MEQITIEFLRTTYPDEITKDQFYRICHISKKTASYLLESGIVPCRNSGKKTRKYKILLTDVIHYLEQRELDPLIFKAPENYYKNGYGERPLGLRAVKLSEVRKDLLRDIFAKQISHYDDVITPDEVAEILGYTTKSVAEWCLKGELKSFLIYNRCKIPKEYLLDFMISERCLMIVRKSAKHKQMLEDALKKV